jgi:hypothetical protein
MLELHQFAKKAKEDFEIYEGVSLQFHHGFGLRELRNHQHLQLYQLQIANLLLGWLGRPIIDLSVFLRFGNFRAASYAQALSSLGNAQLVENIPEADLPQGTDG